MTNKIEKIYCLRLKDADAQALAGRLIWCGIEFSCEYEGCLTLMKIKDKDFETVCSIMKSENRNEQP